jgi:hypothetical protein
LLVEQPRTFPGQRARCQTVAFVAGIHRCQPAPDRRIPGDICVLRPVAEGTGRSKCPIRSAEVVLRASFCALTNRRQGLRYRVAEEDLHGRP